MIRATFLLFLILFLTTRFGHCRSIKKNLSSIFENSERYPMVGLNLEASSTTVTCEPTYGFLPCTTDLWGQLFLIVVYEYLLSVGEKYVSEGSDLFFRMIGPGVIGASLFHIVGAIPELLLVLMSGLSGSSETAAIKAAMGMSVLAGSVVMLLTLIWGSCVAFGSSDLSDDSNLSYMMHNRPMTLTGFGVRTDAETSYTARIMVLSMVPFIILQLAGIGNSSSGTYVVVLVSLLVTLALLFAFSFYQVFQPWIQNRRFEYVIQKFVKDKLLKALSINGEPNVPRIKEMFNEIDKNKDTYISEGEMRMLILGLQLQEDGFIKDSYVEKVMEVFDVNKDALIGMEEFVQGISSWISKAEHKHSSFLRSSTTDQNSQEEQQTLLTKRKKKHSFQGSLWNYIKATYLLLLGTVILALLVDPLIQAVRGFATAANIPSFFVPYVVIPFALNYRRALSAINSARKKTKTAVSLTLSEIYGAAFMNNMIGLTVFLALVYFRHLSWDVSAELLVVVIICTLMGLFASFSTKFPIWTSFVAFLLYVISLMLLYVLTSVLGLS